MDACQSDVEKWRAAAQKELKGEAPETLGRVTADGIPRKPLYTKNDLPENGLLHTYPGVFPFIRGPRATMYANRPWTLRQYGGFSTAEESNAFFKKNLAAGQNGLSVAFDLATHRGYDSDHPLVVADVGNVGVAVDSVEDMKELFRDISLDRVSVSMTMNGAVLPILASYIVAGLEQGVRLDQLSGTIQNDILKEFMVRNTYIYPPAPSMRITSDIIEYTARSMPRFNSMSISGYHMHEAGATATQELAFTLANGVEYVQAALSRGLKIDDFAPRLSFFFAVGMDFFFEVAKLRAARLLWAELMSEFSPQRPESMALRTHCQTSGVSLTAREPYNNIVRTTIEALAAVLGGTQSLHTNAFDEALALPTDFSARVARNTQLILAEETNIAAVIDPMGGSYYVESLTASLADKARKLIAEMKGLGGMTQAVVSGMPKLLIEEAAARRQARIDSGADVVVGVNKYRTDVDDSVEKRKIDNDQVRARQIERLRVLRASRCTKAVASALDALARGAASGKENLLALTIDAVRTRATVGEVSETLERISTRHVAEVRLVKGAYTESSDDPEAVHAATDAVKCFGEMTGNPPRIMIVKLGQDGHDRGAKVIASAFSDFGFEVQVGPLFQTPQAAARQVAEGDFDAVGLSILSGAHRQLVPAFMDAMRQEGTGHIPVFCGGVIPADDHELLQTAGVLQVYGPGTHVPTAAIEILDMVRRSRAGSNRYPALCEPFTPMPPTRMVA